MTDVLEIFRIMKDNPLFAGISPDEFGRMYPCLEGRVRQFRRGEFLFSAGDPVKSVGIVLSGGVQILREDAEGRQNLMAELGPGELFAETFACAGVERSPVSVAASKDCRALFVNLAKLAATCSVNCGFHNLLIRNLLKLVAEKNLLLNRKIEILSKRTTRERLTLFFDGQGAKRFTLSFSREELAAYLCVDRSAMSAELSRMQSDGLIRYHKNEFEIL